MRRGKPDSNQKQIIKELRAMGASVEISSMIGNGFGDIIVGFNEINYILEIKTETGELRDNQVEYHRSWKGTIHTIRSFEEALEIINGGNK
jgi:hypothetical protein